MSTTLVETFAFPQPHELCRDPIDITLDPPQQRVALTFAASYPLSPEEEWTSQLAHLASQHHSSEYNRLKYGPQGCPIRYVPLSIQLPDQFKELQRRQVQYSLEQCWWHCDKPESSATLSATEHQPAVVLLGPEGVPALSMIDLQKEISAAIASPMENTPQSPPAFPSIQAEQQSHPQVKTSSTHPINISTVIPPELNPFISAHLLLSSSSPSHTPPTIFEIPHSLTLDRLTLTQPQHQFLVSGTPPSSPPPSNTNWRSTETGLQDRLSLSHIRTGSIVSEALQAAISSGLAAVGTINAKTNVTSISSKCACDIPLCMPTPTLPHPPGSPLLPQSQFKGGALMTFHSNTSSVSLSLSSTVTSTPLFPLMHSVSSSRPPPPTMSEFLDISSPPPHNVETPRGTPVGAVCEKELETLIPPSISNKDQRGVWDPITLAPFPTHTPSPIPTVVSTLTKKARHNENCTLSLPPFLIGNMFLSSCPGKKVRLQGPVKGRSGVCRDLDTDLKRMGDLGVGCIVCCLDDGELDFLGAPWPEYERISQSVGVDVLRIPTPEGLAPLTPSSLDKHLTDLINAYTLRGVPVLVHCRGGVGRAGVVACCWVVKLGLCGWIEDMTDPNSGAGTTPVPNNWSTGSAGVGFGSVAAGKMGITFSSGMDSPGAVRRDTMQFVEKVIGVVRKRRSVKAVETFEQVKFLVDFVEYLREGKGLGVGR